MATRYSRLQKCSVDNHVPHHTTASNPFSLTRRRFQFASISKLHKQAQKSTASFITICTIIWNYIKSYNSLKIRFRHSGVGTENRITRHANTCPSNCISWILCMAHQLIHKSHVHKCTKSTSNSKRHKQTHPVTCLCKCRAHAARTSIIFSNVTNLKACNRANSKTLWEKLTCV